MSKKIRAYDNKVIADHYAILAQMLEQIQETMKASKTEDLTNLPDSLVPTSTLFNIAVCYSVMYDALVEHSLVSNGHAKPTNTVH